jgi:hypothetical protein
MMIKRGGVKENPLEFSMMRKSRREMTETRTVKGIRTTSQEKINTVGASGHNDDRGFQDRCHSVFDAIQKSLAFTRNRINILIVRGGCRSSKQISCSP